MQKRTLPLNRSLAKTVVESVMGGGEDEDEGMLDSSSGVNVVSASTAKLWLGGVSGNHK